MVCALLPAACALLLAPSSDYGYLLASGVPGAWRITRNGQPWREGLPAQTFLLQDVDGAGSYRRQDALPLEEGAIEMRIALRDDGLDERYASKPHTLLYYQAANGEYLQVSQAARDGVLFLGGNTKGQWQSAYGGRASTRGWKAGEWHHILASYSAKESRMRFFVDGILTADTNERHYWPPEPSGADFRIDDSGHQIRDLVIWNRELDMEEARAHAGRLSRPLPGEVWIPVGGLAEGDSVTLESGGCSASPLVWNGLPIRDPQPASTLLPPGTLEIPLQVRTPVEAACRYAVNSPAPFDEMTPLAGTVTGLSGDPRRADEVFVRCSNDPDFALRLLFRSLPRANPAYPRKSNLWGSSQMLRHGYDFASKVDLYLGAEMPPSDIAALRERNPEILVITSINTVENRGLPEDYYLHDTTGSRIEVWPGTYRLNLTKPYVAEYQARWAYRKMIDSDLLYDGCFFDNFFTSQSWLKSDIHGRQVQLDADEDGKPDDPAWLDAAWRDGVFRELAIWRELMPHAYASGHLPNPATPETGEIFNGNAILFWSTNVLDGVRPFADFWQVLSSWNTLGRRPVLNTIEASPHNQIAYGYGYDILKSMPAPTQEFARDFHRYMRFPLAAALLSDAYFHRDLGDIYHGIDWWYDEYDFDLGHPEGPPELVPTGSAETPNLLLNGGFEQDLKDTWNLNVDSRGTSKAALARDTGGPEGLYCALIDVTSAGTDWHVDFNQRDRSLIKGKSYDLSFWAKASEARTIGLSSQKGVPDWRNYGLSQRVSIGTTWQRHTVSFEANESASDSRIQFFLGAQSGQVWLDDIQLKESPAPVWRRFFTRGAVVLNAFKSPVTVAMPAEFERFQGSQAARHEYIADDGEDGFSAEGDWQVARFDTGQWKSSGPYYHHWGKECRTLEGGGRAEWDLCIPEDGTYALEVWWASAPSQSVWTRKAVYEVVSDGAVIATGVLDQTQPGDRWRAVATVQLSAADRPVLRLRNEGAGMLVADAVHVVSEARFNDGSPAVEVTLAPLDGILLRRR